MKKKSSVKQIVRKLLSRWYYFLLALIVALPLAFAYVELSPRQYRVKASLLLRNEREPGLSQQTVLNGMVQASQSKGNVEDEVGILRSYSMIERAMRELDFGIEYYAQKNFVSTERYGNAPFTITIDSVVNQIVDVPISVQLISSTRYKVKVSAKKLKTYNFYTNQVEGLIDQLEIDEEVPLDKPFINKYLSFSIKFNESFKAPKETETFFVLRKIQSLTEAYQKRLDIDPISGESAIVELNVTGNVAFKEIKFLNKLIEVYLENELYKKNQLGLKTIQFIDNQLLGGTDSLGSGLGSIELFNPGKNILDINSTSESLNRDLAKWEREKLNVGSRLKYYRYIVSSLKSEATTEISTSEALGSQDPALNNLLGELTKLNREFAGLKDNNPLTEIVGLKIKGAKKSLLEKVSTLIETSSVAETDINNRIFQIRRNLSVMPRNESNPVNVQRRFDFNDNIYTYLLEKRADAGIAIAANAVEKTIVDHPYQVGDGPVSPNTEVIFLLAVVVSITGAVLLILIKDLLNDNIMTHEDVEQNTKIPFIGTISHANKREQQTIIAHARSPIGESFRSLRVNLQYLTLGNNANVIGITSSRESEGKTFCAVNLAAVMAYSGRRTILIDTDMRRPRVAEYFQLKNRKGLSNFLVGDGSIKEIINNTEHKGFDVIGSGPIPPNPIDLIGSPRMEELITSLKQTYSTIILDSPPLGYVSEYIILMKYTDANLYIIRSDYTNKNSLAKVNKLFERRKITNVSIVLNDVKSSKTPAYGYDYAYGYKF